jgi:Phage-related protein
MGFIKKIRSLFVGTQSQYNSSINVPVVDYGVSVNNDAALKITAMYSGIRIRSENVASFPKKVLKSTKNGLISEYKHNAYRLISIAPNDYTNVFDFWFSINAALDGWGNAYAVIKRDVAGNPIALHQIHPSCVDVSMVNGNKNTRLPIRTLTSHS